LEDYKFIFNFKLLSNAEELVNQEGTTVASYQLLRIEQIVEHVEVLSAD